MKKDKFKIISYLIVFTIMVSVAIQAFWNYRNYMVNKQQFMFEVQRSLDNAVEAYYANLAKLSIFSLINVEDSSFSNPPGNVLHINTGKDTAILSHLIDSSFDISAAHQFKVLLSETNKKANDTIIKMNTRKLWTGKQPSPHFIKELTNKIVISLESDSLNLSELEGFFNSELDRNNLDIVYALSQSNLQHQNSIENPGNNRNYLIARAGTAYLPFGVIVEIKYFNNAIEILKRGIIGILISLIITGIIISVLIYLYNIIKDQKVLAEIKNDLISNISHEFKTPIATVVSALEGIKYFNLENDEEKTKKYLEISDLQLKKLDRMVEKLLETATLDGDKLELNLERTNISVMLKSLTDKFSIQNNKKNFHTNIKDDVFMNVDPFHLENSISNLIDNAFKYGGDIITVSLVQNSVNIEIVVSDEGGGIAKSQQDKIFEKFYRIPTGNRHDVKGHGIGLYYAKKIIEKHGGNIKLQSSKTKTSFIVIL